MQLLEYMDQFRENDGAPAEEIRHPGISLGQP
jgi:hypothetical protein